VFINISRMTIARDLDGMQTGMLRTVLHGTPLQVRLVRGDLTSLQRATIGALVVIDVHARDVVAEMVDDKVAGEEDFSWQARLRCGGGIHGGDVVSRHAP
jgi:hypothetical protein